MLTNFEYRDWKSVKSPFWKLSSNPNQKGTIWKGKKLTKAQDDTKSEIEKIVVTPEFFPSYYNMKYKEMPQEV